MRLVVSGDLHIGRRHQATYPHIDRLKTTVGVIYDMVNLAVTLDASIVILNGDVLDKAVNAVDILLAVYDAFRYARDNSIDLYYVRGNHEVHDHSALDKCIMYLYRDVCHVVTEPQTIVSDTGIVMLIPWYPQEVFMKKLYEEAALLVRRETRERVLFSHVGLREGRVSPSNYQVPQPISIVDLFPECWDHIFLSDYHMHQTVADNACYMGAPIPHQFGDERNVGVWFCDLAAKEYAAYDITWEDEYWNGPKAPRYPLFKRWSVTEGGTALPINPDDYNEIRCPPHLVEQYAALYRTARVLPEAAPGVTLEAPAEGVRLRRDEITDDIAMVQAWLKYIGKSDDKELEQIGIELIRGTR